MLIGDINMAEPTYEKIVNYLVRGFEENKTASYGIHSILFEDDKALNAGFFHQLALRFNSPYLNLNAATVHGQQTIREQINTFVQDNPKGVILLSEIDQISSSDREFLKEVLQNGESQGINFQQTVIIARSSFPQNIDLALMSRFAFKINAEDAKPAHDNESTTNIYDLKHNNQNNQTIDKSNAMNTQALNQDVARDFLDEVQRLKNDSTIEKTVILFSGEKSTDKAQSPENISGGTDLSKVLNNISNIREAGKKDDTPKPKK